MIEKKKRIKIQSIHNVLFNEQDIFRHLSEIVWEFLKWLYGSWRHSFSFILYTYGFHTDQPPNGYRTAAMCIETATISTV